MPNEIGPIPVYLNGPDMDPFSQLIGMAKINENGALRITIEGKMLVQHVPNLVKLDQIVGLNVGLQYKIAAPIEKD